MINLAVVDPDLAAAIAADTAFSAGLRLHWSGTDPAALLDVKESPDVVILDRARIVGDAGEVIRRLRQTLQAKMVITTYTFATRAEVEALREAGSDVVLQGPLSVRTLRTYLLSLLIQDRIGARTIDTPPPGPNAENGPVTAPRYSRPVLIALRDLSTAIQCECPNHVAELVDRLMAFEQYSKDCENRDDADARVHRALWFATARARRIMEDALEQLVKHEGIVIDVDGVPRRAG